LQPLLEFGKGGVGLLLHQGGQLVQAGVIKLGRGSVASGLRRQGAALAIALQQSPDPGGTYLEEVGDLGAAEFTSFDGGHDASA